MSEKVEESKRRNYEEFLSFFWLLALIIFVRGFVVEPFKIPSGSLIPTLLIGDHLFVAKTSFDIGIPFTNVKLMKVSEPKRGNIIVFKYPNNENNPDDDGKYYIKRLIGLPGDRIAINSGVLFINDQVAGQEAVDYNDRKNDLPGYNHGNYQSLMEETLPETNKAHWILRNGRLEQKLPDAIAALKEETGRDCLPVGLYITDPETDRRVSEDPKLYTLIHWGGIAESIFNQVCEFTVPEGQYFFMGDNRDQSSDSRAWGFVDRKYLVGKALFVWFSLRPMAEGGLGYLVYEEKLNNISGGILGALVQFPRGLIYDLVHWGENRYVRWDRVGMPVN